MITASISSRDKNPQDVFIYGMPPINTIVTIVSITVLDLCYAICYVFPLEEVRFLLHYLGIANMHENALLVLPPNQCGSE
jgi:hypothetical protein